MTSMYDVTLSDLLNRHAAMKTMLVCDRPANLWFDDECREAKIRVRALERQFQESDDPTDRAVWTGGLRSLHSLFNSKKAAATVQMIAAESGDPKRLWRALDATLGLSQPSPDIPHTADQFSDFFADKVARIRALTANAAPPTFPAAPSSVLNSFSAITEETLVELLMRSPCKHSSMDPLPSWLLKQCVSLLAPFLTRLINLSIADSAVPECMKMRLSRQN